MGLFGRYTPGEPGDRPCGDCGGRGVNLGKDDDGWTIPLECKTCGGRGIVYDD